MGWLWWRAPRSAAIWASAALALAVLVFVPWVLYARGGWQQTITTSQFQFAASPRIPLMILHELTGAGYAGAGILLFCAIAALRRPGISFDCKGAAQRGGRGADCRGSDRRCFLRLFPGDSPIYLGIAAPRDSGRRRDGTRSRALADAPAAGPADCLLRRRLRAFFEAATRIGRRPPPNWRGSPQAGACLEVVTPDQAIYYEFFRPELKERRCPEARLGWWRSPLMERRGRRTRRMQG